MLFRRFGFAAAGCFLLTGFSGHALPKDITRDTTTGIVKTIPCETREAIDQVTAVTGQQQIDAPRRDALEPAFRDANNRRIRETMDTIFDTRDRVESLERP